MDNNLYVESSDSSNGSLSPGAISGVVIGSLAFVGLVFALIYWRMSVSAPPRTSSKHPQEQDQVGSEELKDVGSYPTHGAFPITENPLTSSKADRAQSKAAV